MHRENVFAKEIPTTRDDHAHRSIRLHQFWLVMDKPRALHLFFYLISFSAISNYIFQSKENQWPSLGLELLLKVSNFKVKWIRVYTYVWKKLHNDTNFVYFYDSWKVLSRVIVNTNRFKGNYIFQNKENYRRIFWIKLLLNVNNFKVMWIHVYMYFERNCRWYEFLLDTIFRVLSKVIVV